MKEMKFIFTALLLISYAPISLPYNKCRISEAKAESDMEQPVIELVIRKCKKKHKGSKDPLTIETSAGIIEICLKDNLGDGEVVGWKATKKDDDGSVIEYELYVKFDNSVEGTQVYLVDKDGTRPKKAQ